MARKWRIGRRLGKGEIIRARDRECFADAGGQEDRGKGDELLPRCTWIYVHGLLKDDDLSRTSNDWAYQFFTFFMDGIALSWWGSSSSSFTRCARRTGSSSGTTMGKKFPSFEITYRREIGWPSARYLDQDSVRTIPFAAEKLDDPNGWCKAK